MTKQREMVGNGDDKPRLQYVEMRNTIKQKAKENTRNYNQEIVRDIIMASKSLRKVRKTQTLGEDRLIALEDKQGIETPTIKIRS